MKIPIVFYGSSDFSIWVLDAIYESPHIELKGIVTREDAPRGRGGKMARNIVGEWADTHHIPLGFSKGAKEFLVSINPQVVLSASYGKIMKEDELAIPKHGFVNIHGSLLPCLRGAIPIQMAIYKGLKETGISIAQTEKGMDTGAILASKKMEVRSDDRYETLGKRMAEEGSKIFLDILPAYIAPTLKLTAQDEAQATYCYIRDMQEIHATNWESGAVAVDRAIRALSPHEFLTLPVNGVPLQIHSAKPIASADIPVDTHDLAAGESVSWKEHGGRRVVVVTRDGYVELLQVKPQGKQIMSASDAWNGYLHR